MAIEDRDAARRERDEALAHVAELEAKVARQKKQLAELHRFHDADPGELAQCRKERGDAICQRNALQGKVNALEVESACLHRRNTTLEAEVERLKRLSACPRCNTNTHDIRWIPRDDGTAYYWCLKCRCQWEAPHAFNREPHKASEADTPPSPKPPGSDDYATKAELDKLKAEVVELALSRLPYGETRDVPKGEGEG